MMPCRAGSAAKGCMQQAQQLVAQRKPDAQVNNVVPQKGASTCGLNAGSYARSKP